MREDSKTFTTLEAVGVLGILGVTVAIVTVWLTVKAFSACVARVGESVNG
jgi:hypothetical protein